MLCQAEVTYLKRHVSTAQAKRNASIGVTSNKKEITSCGTWPDESLDNVTLGFNCFHAGLVRFVRVWKKGPCKLAIVEVRAKGIKVSKDEG